jgi:hypothetical protein
MVVLSNNKYVSDIDNNNKNDDEFNRGIRLNFYFYSWFNGNFSRLQYTFLNDWIINA